MSFGGYSCILWKEKYIYWLENLTNFLRNLEIFPVLRNNCFKDLRLKNK